MAENDDAEDLAIIFRSAGKPVRMSSATKWRRAITLGDLTRDTPVEIEAGGRSQGVRPAGEVPALRRLFEEIAPTVEADEAAADGEDPQSMAGEPAAPEAAPDLAGVAEAPVRQPPPPSPPPAPPTRPAPPVKPPTASKPKGSPGGCLGVLAVVAIVLFVGIKGCSRRHAATQAADAQTVYVTRQVNLRSEPSSGNAPTGALERGASLVGVWNDTDKTWFKVTAGDHQGSYVWGMDLADRARPDLAIGVETPQTTARAVTEYREPDTTAGTERELAVGESLVTAGKLASGWWEVLNKGKTASAVAGVGYVPPETFDAPAAAAAPVATEATPAGLGVNACNQSDRPIAAAYVYLPRDGGTLWKYKGWMRLAAGECKLLFLTNTADFYLRAETADDGAPLEWGGEVRRCVSYPGPFEYDLEPGGTCPSGTKALGFFRRTPSNASGTYTENFR